MKQYFYLKQEKKKKKQLALEIHGVPSVLSQGAFTGRSSDRVGHRIAVTTLVRLLCKYSGGFLFV